MNVKYSPPIEAGASFNPPNLAKDFILQASVSEAMVVEKSLLQNSAYGNVRTYKMLCAVIQVKYCFHHKHLFFN